MLDTFTDFINICSEEISNYKMHSSPYYEGWNTLFEYYRLNKKLPEGSEYRHKRLSGLHIYGLTNEEAFFILSYSSNLSHWLNASVRRGAELNRCQQYFTEGLKSALDKIPPYNNQIVYRMDTPIGTRQEVVSWFNSVISQVVLVPYFLSTSKFKYEQYEITWIIKTLPNSSKSRDLALLCNNDVEKEVLFKANSFFKVLQVERKEGTIFMEEVDIQGSYIPLTGQYFDNKR